MFGQQMLSRPLRKDPPLIRLSNKIKQGNHRTHKDEEYVDIISRFFDHVSIVVPAFIIVGSPNPCRRGGLFKGCILRVLLLVVVGIVA